MMHRPALHERVTTSSMKLMLAAFGLVFVGILSGCGAKGDPDSSGSGDWYYHWNCNGDSECLGTIFNVQPSGTANEGPVQANCTSLLTFAQHFWGAAATNSCDHSATGSGGTGTGVPAIASFTPTSSAPGTNITITGTGFPTTISQITVTINGATATVVSATTTQIVISLPFIGNFTGRITVTTPGGSVTSSSSITE